MGYVMGNRWELHLIIKMIRDTQAEGFARGTAMKGEELDAAFEEHLFALRTALSNVDSRTLALLRKTLQGKQSDIET